MIKDMTGQKFSRLLVISRSKNDRHGNAMWLCRCDCGTQKVIAGYPLRKGITRSCGCYMREVNSSRVKHGHAGDAMYYAWAGMLRRCDNPKHHKWHRYGGRGIKVCERWKDFSNFLEDMGDRPPNMTLDRIKNDGDYEPGNCRWATQKTQGNNRSNNRLVNTQRGIQTASEASRFLGMSRSAVRWRINAGWDEKDAVSIPAQNARG